jgi:hypothetical protein
MCNLYRITKVREAVRRLFSVSDNCAAAYDPLSVVFPPIVRRAAVPG